MKRVVWAAVLVLLCAALSAGGAEQKKLYLKRPVVTGAVSELDAKAVAAAFQSRMTILLLEKGTFGVVNDDDVASLLEEAKQRAALDCDSEECLVAIADMLGVPLVVRTTVGIQGKAKGRVDVQLSERTSGGGLRVVSAAAVEECNPFDADQVNWYVREIVGKLQSVSYQMKPYLAETVGVKIELTAAQSIQMKGLEAPVQRVAASLPEVKVEVSGDAARQVSTILKDAISTADILARDLKLDEAEQAYLKVQDKAKRYTAAYKEMADFDPIVVARIGELRRLRVEKMIADADALETTQAQRDAYVQAERFRASVEKRYAPVVSVYAKTITERINAAHGKALKAMLDAGDESLGSGKAEDATHAYLGAREYLVAHKSEVEKKGAAIAPFIDQRLLVGYTALMDEQVRQAERSYMDYRFSQAEDGFAEAVKTAKSCPLFGDVTSVKREKAGPEQKQFLDLWQSASAGAQKSKETGLRIFRNQASVDLDMIVRLDARDEREKAEAKLDEMGMRVGASRYRQDATARGYLKTACSVLGREMDSLLLASPEVRSIVKSLGGHIETGCVYLQVQADEIAMNLGAGTVGLVSGKEGFYQELPRGVWAKLKEGSCKILALRQAWQVRNLKPGYFYRITVAPKIPERPVLESPAGLPGYQATPGEPVPEEPVSSAKGLPGATPQPFLPQYLPESKSATQLNWDRFPGDEMVVPGMLWPIGGAVAGYALASSGSTSNQGIGLVIGTLVGLGVDFFLALAKTPTEETSVELSGNVGVNNSRRADWERRVAEIEGKNQPLIDAENARRTKRNADLKARYETRLSAVNAANKALLDRANGVILTENAALRKANPDRGSAVVDEIGPAEFGMEPAKQIAAVSTAYLAALPLPASMVRVDGGSFLMGERPAYQVSVSNFFMGKWEVTQKEWSEVMGSNPSTSKGDNLPVESVAWFDAVLYCNRLSALNNREPCYLISGTDVTCDISRSGFRLPTEAEWEFAARGGSLTTGFAYSGGSQVDFVGWYRGNSDGKTHVVGGKAPNELGLYDMTGNVWEWCWDFRADYGTAPQIDPMGPLSGDRRVLRGASKTNDEPLQRVFLRHSEVPSGRFRDVGFRVVARDQ
jgi:formylglycine-generating enzyme